MLQEKQQKMVQVLVSLPPTWGDPDGAPGFGLQPGPALDFVAAGGGSQQAGVLYVSLLLTLTLPFE